MDEMWSQFEKKEKNIRREEEGEENEAVDVEEEKEVK